MAFVRTEGLSKRHNRKRQFFLVTRSYVFSNVGYSRPRRCWFIVMRRTFTGRPVHALSQATDNETCERVVSTVPSKLNPREGFFASQKVAWTKFVCSPNPSRNITIKSQESTEFVSESCSCWPAREMKTCSVPCPPPQSNASDPSWPRRNKGSAKMQLLRKHYEKIKCTTQ